MHAEKAGIDLLTFYKYITQVILYLFELCIAISALFTLRNYIADKSLFSWINNVLSFEFVEESILYYGIYQIVIFVFLSLYDSARKDSILSKIKMIKLGIVRLEYDKPFEDLETIYQIYVLNNSLLVNKTDKVDVEEAYYTDKRFRSGEIDKNNYKYYLKNKLVNLEHEYEYYDLAWRLSLLLRRFK